MKRDGEIAADPLCILCNKLLRNCSVLLATVRRHRDNNTMITRTNILVFLRPSLRHQHTVKALRGKVETDN